MPIPYSWRNGRSPCHLGLGVQNARFFPSERASTPAVQRFHPYPSAAGVSLWGIGSLSRRTITENRDARSPISSYSQEPFPNSWPDNAGPPLPAAQRRTRDKSQPMWRRIEAAKAAAPYRHIRLMTLPLELCPRRSWTRSRSEFPISMTLAEILATFPA